MKKRRYVTAWLISLHLYFLMIRREFLIKAFLSVFQFYYCELYFLLMNFCQAFIVCVCNMLTRHNQANFPLSFSRHNRFNTIPTANRLHSIASDNESCLAKKNRQQLTTKYIDKLLKFISSKTEKFPIATLLAMLIPESKSHIFFKSVEIRKLL